MKFAEVLRTPPVAASVNWNIEKSTTLNSEGVKRGTKKLNMKNTKIFHLLSLSKRYLPAQIQ